MQETERVNVVLLVSVSDSGQSYTSSRYLLGTERVNVVLLVSVSDSGQSYTSRRYLLGTERVNVVLLVSVSDSGNYPLAVSYFQPPHARNRKS